MTKVDCPLMCRRADRECAILMAATIPFVTHFGAYAVYVHLFSFLGLFARLFPKRAITAKPQVLQPLLCERFTDKNDQASAVNGELSCTIDPVPAAQK